MKKFFKRMIAVLLLSSVCLFALVPPSFALEDTQKIDVGDVTEFGNYSEYLLSNQIDNKSADKTILTQINQTSSGAPIVFSVEVPSDAFYTIGMSYKALGSEISAIEVDLKIDGKTPFSEAEKLYFPRMWQDEAGNRVDGMGNEFAAKQVPYDGYRFNLALDVTKRTADPYLAFLTAGIHEITLTSVSGSFELEYFEFGIPEEPSNYQQEPYMSGAKAYLGESVIIEGEKPFLKNSYWLGAKTDNSSVEVTPNDPTKSRVNFVGGGNWKTSGETIVWETPELSEGYYQLGFLFRQSQVMGSKTYRKLTIDGKVPFKEAEAIGFMYDDGWQQSFFSDDNDKPYLIYLAAGKHEIALTVVPGEIAEVRDELNDAVTELGSLYIDMTMITGETVDIYRDYDLFAQIPDMEERLDLILKTLNSADEKLKVITGQNTGSYSSVIKNMARVVDQMLNNRYSAQRYIEEYYTRYTAMASVLFEMQSMPLDIDKIVLTSPDQKTPFKSEGFLKQILFSVQRFFVSFVQDYNNISGVSKSSEPVTIWVNWGRDQTQVLNSLVQTSFTEKTGIPVSIQLVNASIVQAVLSGKGPDVILQHSRSEPVNLAMRGVLYDLTQFDDLENVLERFQKGAETPYKYKNGLYALPDTQVFYLMYYRKDILNKLGLSVPKTWDDFQEISNLIVRRNLNVWMPNTPATNTTQVNAGIGSINLFPTFLMQKGLNIYSDNGRSTNLLNSDVMVTFSEWTDYYRKLKVPISLDFYNRFRTGTCPIGISGYTLYTTLKAAAPEIEGLWGVAPIPGTVLEDGTVNFTSSGGGTACAMLKAAKNPDDAWEFLKWWTDADTQLSYSNETEALLGPTGRVAVANIAAFKRMAWDAEMLEPILKAWEQVQEIPEYPGSYYVSRSVYQSFWNVVESNQNPKDMLLKYGKQANQEIERKWKQYENR